MQAAGISGTCFNSWKLVKDMKIRSFPNKWETMGGKVWAQEKNKAKGEERLTLSEQESQPKADAEFKGKARQAAGHRPTWGLPLPGAHALAPALKPTAPILTL